MSPKLKAKKERRRHEALKQGRKQKTNVRFQDVKWRGMTGIAPLGWRDISGGNPDRRAALKGTSA